MVLIVISTIQRQSPQSQPSVIRYPRAPAKITALRALMGPRHGAVISFSCPLALRRLIGRPSETEGCQNFTALQRGELIRAAETADLGALGEILCRCSKGN